MIGLWALRGREPKGRRPPGDAPILTPPSGLEPEEVGLLLRQQVEAPVLLALLLNLAKKGYVGLQGPAHPGGYVLEEKQIELTDKARSVVAELEGWSTEPPAYQRTLLQAMVSDRNRIEAIRFSAKMLTRSIGDRLAAGGLLAGSPARVRRRYAIATIVIGTAAPVLVVLGYVVAALYSYVAVNVGLFIGSFAIVGIGYYMPRATEKGAEEKARWEGFLDQLRDRIESLAGSSPEESVRLLDANMALLPLISTLQMSTWLKSPPDRLPAVPHRPYWYHPIGDIWYVPSQNAGQKFLDIGADLVP